MSSIKLRNDHQPKFQSFSYSIFGSSYFWLLQKCTCAFTFSLPLAGKLTLPLNCLSSVFANIHCLFPYQLCTCAQVHFLSTCSKFLLLHPARLSCSLASLAAQPFQRQLEQRIAWQRRVESRSPAPAPLSLPSLQCHARSTRLCNRRVHFALHGCRPPPLFAPQCAPLQPCNAMQCTRPSLLARGSAVPRKQNSKIGRN